MVFLLLAFLGSASALVVPLSAARPAIALEGVALPRVGDGETVDIGAALATSKGKTLLVLGTHAGDFNTVECACASNSNQASCERPHNVYALSARADCQRVRHAWPLLQEKGVTRCLMVVNGSPESCALLRTLLDVPSDVELLSDPTGEAGRRFGVSRGFRPDDERLSPFVKLFAMGIGVGPPWQTLPAVLTGYFGDPNGSREWIETGLKQGQLAGRWPSVLEMDKAGAIVANKFGDTPLLSGWGRRPFEVRGCAVPERARFERRLPDLTPLRQLQDLPCAERATQWRT
jgi:hypothetical protein